VGVDALAHLDSHHNATIGHLVEVNQSAGRPNGVRRVQVARFHLQPPSSPFTHRITHRLEFPTHCGQLPSTTSTGGRVGPADDALRSSVPSWSLSNAFGMPGAPALISVNVAHPASRLRM